MKSIKGMSLHLFLHHAKSTNSSRYAGFYVIGIASSGLSGLLAYGIEKMEGDAGIRGWSWIFILVSLFMFSISDS